MDLEEMRTKVRRDLKDEDASDYQWTDDELDRHIDRAVREFSEHVPLENRTSLATVAGSREVDIATLADRVMVEAVEYPSGFFPPRLQAFSLWGNTLTMLGDEIPDGSAAVVYHGDVHTLDCEGSTVPSRYEDIVAAGAAAYAALAWGVRAVNRVNAGGTGTPKDYLEWGRERLTDFRRQLRRLGRRNRVRISSLYMPWTPVSGKEESTP